jgi:hypothetical protein
MKGPFQCGRAAMGLIFGASSHLPSLQMLSYSYEWAHGTNVNHTKILLAIPLAGMILWLHDAMIYIVDVITKEVAILT